MLNQESRARVEKLLKKLDNYYDPQSVSLTVDDFEWLAEKLIEEDDLSTRLYAELQTANEELARRAELD